MKQRRRLRFPLCPRKRDCCHCSMNQDGDGPDHWVLRFEFFICWFMFLTNMR
ncbi:unnamed protein product [Arabidopsis halleri]